MAVAEICYCWQRCYPGAHIGLCDKTRNVRHLMRHDSRCDYGTRCEMIEYFVCGMRFRHHVGPRGTSRKARKATAVCYGPFKTESDARTWRDNHSIHMRIETK